MAVRAPYVLETSRSNMYTDGATPVGPTTVYPGLAGATISGATTGSNGDEITYSVAGAPAGSTFAWTVTGGTATIDPVAANTESVAITFSSAATFSVQCVVTLAGDANSPKTITQSVVIS